MLTEEEYIGKVVSYVDDTYKRKIVPKLNLDIYVGEILTHFYNQMPDLNAGETFEFRFDLLPIMIPQAYNSVKLSVSGRNIKYPNDFFASVTGFKCKGYTRQTETKIKQELNNRGIYVSEFRYGTDGKLEYIIYLTDFSGAIVGEYLARRLEHAINANKALTCKTNATTSDLTIFIERVDN